MSNRKLTILGIIAAIFVIWAVVQSYISNRPPAKPDIQTYLILGLDPADIGTIILGTGEDAVTLKRNQGQFFIANKDNYPADTSKINDLITSCLDIKTLEFYTDNPENHKDLGVTEKTARNVIKFLKPDSEPLAGVVIGNAKEQGQGTFVRLLSSDKVYVAQKTPWIRDQAMDYIDQELTSIEREQIQAVTVSSPNDVYTLRKDKEDQSIILENLPEGKKLKSGTYNNVFTALTNLRFDDVKKYSAKDQELKFDNQFVCRLKNSTVYTVKIAKKDDKTYVTCDAEFTDKTPVTKTKGEVESEEELKKKEAKLLARDKAEEFSKKRRGWLYQIPEYKAENLTKKLSDLLEDVEKPEEKAQDESENKKEEKPAEQTEQEPKKASEQTGQSDNSDVTEQKK